MYNASLTNNWWTLFVWNDQALPHSQIYKLRPLNGSCLPTSFCDVAMNKSLQNIESLYNISNSIGKKMGEKKKTTETKIYIYTTSLFK